MMAMPFARNPDACNPEQSKIVPIRPPQDEGLTHSFCATLDIDQIQPYAGNPRIADNPMKEEIKASIMARGMDAPLCVARRPGDEPYTLCAGGNTRLSILRELWHETHEERFHTVPVMIYPWIDEVHTLLGHITENTMRGEMCFADTAAAIIDIKVMLEQTEGPITWASFERRLPDFGLKVSHTQLARMKFMEDHLSDIPEDIRIHIGPHHVQKLMCAIKNTEYAKPENHARLCETMSRHGMDIDASIEEITRPSPMNECDQYESIPESTSDDPDATMDRNQSVAQLLQSLLDLRRANCRIVMDSPCGRYFEEADNLCGFRMKGKPPEATDIATRVLADLCNRAGGEIKMNDFCLLDDNAASATVQIMSNIRRMHTISKLCVDNEIHDATDCSNKEILHIMDEISPEEAAKRRLLLQYIRCGATTIMIMSLFPSASIQFIREMRQLSGTQNSGGRPAVAFPTEACRAWRLWNKYSGTEEKQRFLDIAVETKLPLGTVWNTIKSRLHEVENDI